VGRFLLSSPFPLRLQALFLLLLESLIPKSKIAALKTLQTPNVRIASLFRAGVPKDPRLAAHARKSAQPRTARTHRAVLMTLVKERMESVLP
jgi:hypothetical protein